MSPSRKSVGQWARGIVAVLAVPLLLSSAAADDRRLPDAATPQYRKQWAIVIGIDYVGRDDAAIDGLQSLRNAESDARAFAELLIAHYGYTEETVHLLLGPAATKAAIEGLFGKRFLRDPRQVDEADSVLVFFAGHGDRETANDRTKAFLYPYDVLTIPGLGIDDATCVKIDYLVSELQLCAARHRLIILDSCHSGEVFHFTQSRRSGRFAVDPELFKHSVVQAMASARSFQAADDTIRRGGDAAPGPDADESGHSPFTTALLEALTSGIQARAFGASALFARIPERVKELASTQHPQGGTLSGDGEFYFFRRGDALLQAAADSPNYLLQSLPGLQGKWWFDEVPWLIPTLRGEPRLQSLIPTTIAARKVLPTGEVLPAEISREGLFQPRAQDVYESIRARSEEYVKQWPSAQRLAFQRLLEFSDAELGEEAEARLLSTLNALDDPHFRAVVHHRFNKPDAEQLYQQAIAAYEARLPQTAGTPSDLSGLYRLCLSDFGRFMDDTGFPGEAAGYFRLAREVEASDSLSPIFAIHTMIWESTSRARQGEWQAADDLLIEAEQLARVSLAPEHCLLAAIHDRVAWNAMNRWQLDVAVEQFKTAIGIRDLNGADDITTRIARYHDRHGLAMAQRYQARFDESRAGYEQLRVDLRNEVQQTASRQQSEAIHQRLVNTLERLGDSYLYARPRLPFEAAEVYQEAIERCRQMAPHQQSRTRAQLSCKLAVAMALAGDPSAAMTTLADAVSGDMAQLIGQQSQGLVLFQELATAVLKLTQQDLDGGREGLRAILTSWQLASDTLERKQLEVLLFAGDLLLSFGAEQTAQADAELVLKIVPEEFINPTNLPYLRPYFDAALERELDLASPFALRRLARIILKAKTGLPVALPLSEQSVIFYLGDRDGRVLLIPPVGSPQRPELIGLDFGKESLAEAKLPEPLADRLRQELPTVIFWSDHGVEPRLTNDSFPFERSAASRLSAE